MKQKGKVEMYLVDLKAAVSLLRQKLLDNLNRWIVSPVRKLINGVIHYLRLSRQKCLDVLKRLTMR